MWLPMKKAKAKGSSCTPGENRGLATIVCANAVSAGAKASRRRLGISGRNEVSTPRVRRHAPSQPSGACIGIATDIFTLSLELVADTGILGRTPANLAALSSP